MVSPPFTVAIDTGGTFTDLVARDAAGRITRLKVPSTPADPSEAVGNAIAELLGAHALDLGDFVEIRHGSTVGSST